MSKKKKSTFIQGKNGWVTAKRVRQGNFVTLTVEGLDNCDRSVAGVALDKPSIERLARRLQNILDRWP